MMKRKEFLLAGGLLLVAAMLRLAFFSGIYGHDDWAYLFYLRSFLNGQTDELLHSLWGLRFPIWLPIAGSFDLFGIAYRSAFLPGFLFGLATVPMVYAGLRSLGLSVRFAALGGLFLILNPIDWLVSSTIRGDIEMSFYGGAILLLLLRMRGTQGTRRKWWGVATGLVWGLSAITKEWGFVFAWGIFAVAVVDAISQRRLPWEYLAIGLGFCAILAIDAAVLKLVTGDWFARVHTSITWYQRAAARGEYLGDDSVRLSYLPKLLLGVRPDPATAVPFPNYYPYYGPYMWLLLLALPICLFRRSPARPAAWFVVGILLWIEFGSMSWREYLPYHKEPRYFSIISVPAAIAMGAAAAWVFTSRSGVVKRCAAGLVAIVALVVVQVVAADRHAYASGRDYMPALVRWTVDHPRARLWVRASLQNELDLRSGYRFSDPVHGHAGRPGYGSIMDACFWAQRQAGDFVLVEPDWREFSAMYPDVDRRRLKLTELLPGRFATGGIYEFQPFRHGEGAYFLSDDEPVRETHSFGGPRWDISFDSNPIRLNGVRYRKGIGSHSRSEIVFVVDPRHAFFSAEVGLDDDMDRTPGSVVFSVYADDDLKYRSPVMRWDSPTQSVRVDVTGAATLRLVVDDAGDGDTCDHAVWANAEMSAGARGTPWREPVN